MPKIEFPTCDTCGRLITGVSRICKPCDPEGYAAYIGAQKPAFVPCKQHPWVDKFKCQKCDARRRSTSIRSDADLRKLY